MLLYVYLVSYSSTNSYGTEWFYYVSRIVDNVACVLYRAISWNVMNFHINTFLCRLLNRSFQRVPCKIILFYSEDCKLDLTISVLPLSYSQQYPGLYTVTWETFQDETGLLGKYHYYLHATETNLTCTASRMEQSKYHDWISYAHLIPDRTVNQIAVRL